MEDLNLWHSAKAALLALAPVQSLTKSMSSAFEVGCEPQEPKYDELFTAQVN